MNKIPGIYCFIDPRTNEIKYVGMGQNWQTRSVAHFCPSTQRKYKHLPLYKWLKKLNRLNLVPHIHKYKTIKEASMRLNVSCTSISFVLNGHKTSVKGYTFKNLKEAK
jgi:hypothetical protein